mmetsp:Transcript_30178/g.89614  ORF Transcript_30178/g.89614 Transcript_30178/m.89614 type:complete len:205 (-) Transcript_30178:1033-1647(-)
MAFSRRLSAFTMLPMDSWYCAFSSRRAAVSASCASRLSFRSCSFCWSMAMNPVSGCLMSSSTWSMALSRFVRSSSLVSMRSLLTLRSSVQKSRCFLSCFASLSMSLFIFLISRSTSVKGFLPTARREATFARRVDLSLSAACCRSSLTSARTALSELGRLSWRRLVPLPESTLPKASAERSLFRMETACATACSSLTRNILRFS